jgi:transcriptional antiterminator RfaH
MPVLKLEPSVYPENLFEDSDDSAPGQWWVLHTKPRAEKSVARRLLSRGVDFYLPLYARPVPSRHGKKEAHHPLFPGYLFLRGADEARMAALETGSLAGCLIVHDQSRMRQSLKNIYRLLKAELDVRPEVRLKPGQLVEIVAGPFLGMTGKWVREGGRGRFLIEVQMLQQGVSVEIDEWMVRAV